MKKYLGYIGAFYLGFSLSCFAKLTLDTWQLWAILVPVLFLFVADKQLNKED